jgi:hypothetical protein
MRRFEKMDYCFDTSALGAKNTASLYDDSDRAAVVAGLLASGRVVISAVNVIEACGCEDPARRIGLLRLQSQLSQDHRPLLVPNELLRALTIARHRGDRTATITISDRHSGIWWGLHEPEQLSEVERAEVYQWKKSLELPFDQAHQQTRSEFEKMFHAFPHNKPLSVAKFIKFLRQNEKLILDAASPAHQRITGVGLDFFEMGKLFQELPAWPLYLAGWAYSLYHRAIKAQGFGVPSNPGTIDLMSAIYLNYCDYFITSDVKQRRALRVLNAFNPHQPKTQIISYQEFRNRLIIRSAA